MIFQDLQIILYWWLILFLIGISLLPVVTYFFASFIDRGYIFSKILSIAVLSYVSFLLGVMHLVPFTRASLIGFTLLFFVTSFWIARKNLPKLFNRQLITFIFLEEAIFLIVMSLWTIIRGYNPEIHGLEKYMDFGFINSILRSEFFPPKDMWLTPYSINYYYFGHFYSAVLTKLSGIPSNLTYNLILGTVAGLCFTAAFSIGMTLISPIVTNFRKIKILMAGLLSGLLVTFAGNIHTLYTLFKPYENEHPVPPWSLEFSPLTFPNNYWYPNATRFIYNTIHEFPIYSWVVADLHGHVLDIPFVLLTIALLCSYVITKKSNDPQKSRHIKKGNISHLLQGKVLELGYLLMLSFLLAVMYMTNAWDGLIYLLLAGIVIVFTSLYKGTAIPHKNIFNIANLFQKEAVISVIIRLSVVFIGFVIFSLPFSLFFKPFVSGIGVLCAPDFLTKIGGVGPLLFEPNHCQHSPWWQLLILYGFFFFCIASLLLFLRKNKKVRSDYFVGILIALSLILILIPELIYAKDIYPAHYRANTMFKLVFQSFIMLSLVSGYTVVRIISHFSLRKANTKLSQFGYPAFIITAIILLSFVLIYPYFAVMSYYNNLTTYQGINGTSYLKNLYPSDFEAISWLQENIKGQPVILEAQGDSYTDYGRVSTNTGLPTVLGWTVHEWLWRGQYDYEENDERKTTDTTPYFPAPRIGDVQKLYESTDLQETIRLVNKYEIEYVFMGDLERQKYPGLYEQKWEELGDVIYETGQTHIYKIDK